MALARTMTLKASAAGLDLGGGKAVVIDDGDTGSRAARLERQRAWSTASTAYITAEDIGTTADMDFMSRFTDTRSAARARTAAAATPPVTAETVFRPAPRAHGGHRHRRARGPPEWA